MKYFVLTLFFCAFVATAFSVPVAQDEASDIAAKMRDAIPKLQKAVTGLRADGMNEAADKVQNVIPLLKIWTNEDTVRANIGAARVVKTAVENLLNVTRRYWENSALFASSADIDAAISELFPNSEAQDIVNKFVDAIPKLEKVERGLRADGQTEAADKLKQVLPTLRTFYTNVAFVSNNIENARKVWTSVENLLNVTRRYWDNSALLANAADVNVAISELFANSEAQDLVNKFLDAIPKLEKVERGLRADGQIESADKLKNALPGLKIFYTNVDFVQANIAIARQVWNSVDNILKATRHYWDNSALTVSTLSNSLIGAELSNLENSVATLDENDDQEVIEIVNQFKEALPKLHKIADGLRKDGKEDAADKMVKLAEGLKVYTVEENVRAHKTISKIVLRGVQFVIRLGKKYLEEEQSAVVITQF